MADVAAMAQNEPTTNPNTSNKIVFEGSQRNLAVAVAMFATAALAFSMDLAHVFFAKAMTWTFVLWGAMLLYGNLLDIFQSYEVTDDALIVRNPIRFLLPVKTWEWSHISRMDLIVKRMDAAYEDAVLQIYYTPPGEVVIEREDRVYDPELARLIIERAGLKAVDVAGTINLTQLPKGKAQYYWNTSGRMTAGG